MRSIMSFTSNLEDYVGTPKFPWLLLLFFVVFVTLVSCSRLQVTKGTATEKIKANVVITENCKTRVKFKEQKINCKWKF